MGVCIYAHVYIHTHCVVWVCGCGRVGVVWVCGHAWDNMFLLPVIMHIVVKGVMTQW